MEVIFKLTMSFSYIQHRTQILLVIAGEEKYGPLVASGTATMVRSPNLNVNWLVTRIQNVLLMIEFQMQMLVNVAYLWKGIQETVIPDELAR